MNRPKSSSGPLLVALALSWALFLGVGAWFFAQYRQLQHKVAVRELVDCARAERQLLAEIAGRPDPDAESEAVLRLVVARCRRN